jgi:hypothetical protein
MIGNTGIRLAHRLDKTALYFDDTEIIIVLSAGRFIADTIARAFNPGDLGNSGKCIDPFFMPPHTNDQLQPLNLLLFSNFKDQISQTVADFRCPRNHADREDTRRAYGGRDALQQSNVISTSGNRDRGRAAAVKTGHPICQRDSAPPGPGTRPGITRKTPNRDYTVNQCSDFLSLLFALRDDRTQSLDRFQ